MNILFLCDNFPPEINAPATRTYEHTREWIKRGVSVTVVTCNPNYPQGKIYNGYKNKFPFQTEMIEGIKVIRVWSYMTANEGSLKRTLDQLSFGIASFIVGLFIKTDLIIATSPQFFTVISGYFLSVFRNKKWVFELRDLIPDTIRSVSAIRNGRLLNLLEKIELFLYKKADLIIALTNAFKKNLVLRGIDNKKIKVVPNGANVDFFTPRAKDQELEEKLKIKDKFVIGYIGTHGLTQNLPSLIRGLTKLKDSELVFLFIGEGALKNEMKEAAKGVQNVEVCFIDQVSKQEIIKYWSILDVSLIALRKDPTFLTVIPSKMFEAAAMKKPILLGVEGQAQEILDEYECGLSFEPENPQDLIEKAYILKNNKRLYSHLSENCRKLASDYNREDLALLMLDHLKALLK